jgi:glycine cleavage system H protein
MTTMYTADHEWINIEDHEAATVGITHHLYMPVTGEIVEVNEALRDDPALANSDPLGTGWFFKVRVTNMAEFDQLMDPPAYDLLVKNAS